MFLAAREIDLSQKLFRDRKFKKCAGPPFCLFVFHIPHYTELALYVQKGHLWPTHVSSSSRTYSDILTPLICRSIDFPKSRCQKSWPLDGPRHPLLHFHRGVRLAINCWRTRDLLHVSDLDLQVKVQAKSSGRWLCVRVKILVFFHHPWKKGFSRLLSLSLSRAAVFFLSCFFPGAFVFFAHALGDGGRRRRRRALQLSSPDFLPVLTTSLQWLAASFPNSRCVADP